MVKVDTIGILLATLVSSDCLVPQLSTRTTVTKLHGTTTTVSVPGLDEGLKMRPLPGTDILVSEVCLGTMMFGEQVSKADAYAQLDMATKDYGLNFIDTAELWPCPSAPGTMGASESIIGSYLKKDGNDRSKLVISSKISGFSEEITWARKDGKGTRVIKAQITEAVDAQLRRLGTDYIDVLQIHWPDRYIPLHGAPTYEYGMERPENDVASFQEQIEAIDGLVKAGKVRTWGVSNETPYGMSAMSLTAQHMGLAKPSVVQNPYNLLERNDFECGMQETCSPSNCNVGLLAYSPLAGGALSGKYANPRDEGLMHARLHKYVGFQHRYLSDPSRDAVARYSEVAREFDLPLATVALAFVYSRPFVTSTIVGASTTDQLRSNILSLNLPINEEMEQLLTGAYRKGMNPTKGVFEVRDPYREYVDPSKLPWGAKDQDVDPELDVLINQRLSKL